jgi:hypothetical protein
MKSLQIASGLAAEQLAMAKADADYVPDARISDMADANDFMEKMN